MSKKKWEFGNEQKIWLFGSLYFIFSIICLCSYPFQKVNIATFTPATEPYLVEKLANVTEKYPVNETYYENDCTEHPENSNDVYIQSAGYYGYFYETKYDSGKCVISDVPSGDSQTISIKNSGSKTLHYPIFVEYYDIEADCGVSTIDYYNENILKTNFSDIVVGPGKSYYNWLSYMKVYDLRPLDSQNRITTFSFYAGTPKSCEEIMKKRSIEKSRIVERLQNMTLYKDIVVQNNLTLNLTLFQKWGLSTNTSTYNCPTDYVVINNSCQKLLT